MAIRTIQSPGVEITERDLSQYVNGPVGTAVLVTGFAAKGRDYEPILLTSRSAWLQQFGEPTNEAERYFFNACMEVINQGGKLYACKLPYKNAALDKFTAKTYTVNVSKLQQLSTVTDYATRYSLNEILAGDYTEFGIGTLPDEDLKNAFLQAKDTQTQIEKFSDATKNFTIAIPYAYALSDWMGQIDIENQEEDNWMYTPVMFIMAKLSAVFDGGSTFRQNLQGLSAVPELSDFFWKEVSGERVPIPTKITFTSELPEGAGAEKNVQTFIGSILDGLGGNDEADSFKAACDPSTGVTIDSVLNTYSEFADSAAYKFFQANEDLFNALNMIDFNGDDEYLSGQKPYFYCDDERFNLGSYYRASKLLAKAEESRDAYNNADAVEFVNNVIKLDKFFDEEESSLSTIFDKFLAMGTTPVTADYWTEDDNDELKTILITRQKDELLTPLDVLREAFKKLFDSEEYKELVAKAKDGVYNDSPFAKVAIQYYMDNTLIPNPDHKKILRDATNLNVFYLSVDADGDGPSKLLSTFFQMYNGENSASPELSSPQAVIDGAISQLRYDDLLKFATDFTDTSTYVELSGIAYGETGTYTQKETISALNPDMISSVLAFSEIKKADPTVKSYLTIDSKSDTELVDLETIDGYATGETPVRTNKIVIVDKTRGTLGTAYAKADNGDQKELVGIIPVITTAANALYAQALLETGDTGITKYNAIKTATTLYTESMLSNGIEAPFEIKDEDAAVPFMSDKADVYTVSQLVAGSFPSIHFDADGHLDRQNMKKIGVVVLRAFLDPGEGNKVNYDIVEALSGELDKNAVDPNTGATTFIDSVVNSQSEYIELYSNCFNQTATREMYSKMDLLVLNEPQKAGDLGFYQYMTKKNISLTDSILKALPLIWEKNEDINEKQIDIVCDAGVSNIAQFIKSVFNGRSGEYDPASEYASLFKLRNKEDTKTWRAVLDMYDNFCKNIRKDCMFVADGPRPFCLVGNKKIVRPSKPSNTIDASILPMLKYITGVNTNYGAGYCDWFQKADEFSGDYFWCPPSIQAMGVYLNTDINFDYWMAPAGLNRGIVSALDVAFNPTQRQSDEIYPKCWNYARNYPNDGIVLEGQRTFQTKATALDRVNVRRAMLRFERTVYELARWFVYENNTTYTRQRLYDAIDGVFKEIKGQGGMIDYKIICDETINTPEVIDRNELRVKIGIKPVKAAEFILIEFNVMRQSGSWSEML